MVRQATCECRLQSPSATLDGKTIRAGGTDGVPESHPSLTLAVGPLHPWTVLEKADVGGETLL